MKHPTLNSCLTMFIFIFFVQYSNVHGQNNLIPNASFELGFQNVGCLYQPSNFGKTTFNNTISHWQVATHPNYGVPDWYDSNNSGCMDWLNYFHCEVSLPKFAPSVFPSRKFLFLNSRLQQTNVEKKFVRDVVRASFVSNQKLISNKFYIFRLKIIPTDNGVQDPILSDYNCELRIFFTKFSEQWNSNSSNNEKWECINCNISLTNNISCEGYNIQKEFLSPTFQNLQNIILYQQYNGFLIDDIELYEKCPASMVIQNRTFDNYFYSSTFQNGQTFTYEAAQYLYAGNGNWQNTPELIIEKGADIIFTAGEAIDLLPGFTAENNFDAYITPCGGGNRMAADTNQSNNQYFVNENENEDTFFEPAITIYPNPSSGIFTIESEEAINPQQIEVYDVFGKRVQPIINPNGTTATINLENHSKGIYLVRIGIFKQKIVLE